MRSDLELIRLQDQIQNSKPELLDRQIREFCCAKDQDIELIKFYQENGYALVKNELYPSGYYKMFKTLPKIPVGFPDSN